MEINQSHEPADAQHLIPESARQSSNRNDRDIHIGFPERESPKIGPAKPDIQLYPVVYLHP